MKKLLITAAIIAFSTLPASAAEPYFSLGAGAWLPHSTSGVDYGRQLVATSYSPGFGLSGAAGIGFRTGTRLECELSYKQASAKGTNNDTWLMSYMINLWQSMPGDNYPISPYFGGGIGVARGHVASPGFVDASGNGVAYQVGGGLDIKLSQKMTADIGYRYAGMTDSSNNSINKASADGSYLQAALRMNF